MFNVNFENIVFYLLPPHLRAVVRLAYINSVVRAFNYIYDIFKAYRNDTIELLSFSSIHKELEYILNLRFNGGSTGIEIETNIISTIFVFNKSENADELYLFNDSEGQPLYLKNKSEIDEEYTFTVRVPAALQLTVDENEIKGLVNFYKLASKNYNLIYY